MSESLGRILSPERAGGFVQFIKYGIVGVASTLVQVVAFYALASTALKCLAADDSMVQLFGLPSVDVTHSVRAFRFAVATGIGFLISNVFCWLMNRAFVFKAGKFAWWKELALFIGVSGLAMIIATLASSAAIRWGGMMTTLAVFLEIVVSFLFNYFLRKFFIFRG